MVSRNFFALKKSYIRLFSLLWFHEFLALSKKVKKEDMNFGFTKFLGLKKISLYLIWFHEFLALVKKENKVRV